MGKTIEIVSTFNGIKRKFTYQKNSDSILPDDVRFDPQTKRFRYIKSGRFASRSDTLELQRTFITQLEEDLVNLALDLKQGKIGAYRDAANVLKRIHLNHAAIAKNGVDKLSQRDLGLIGSILKQQYYQGKDNVTDKKFGLKHLINDIQEQDLSEARIRQRLRLFAQSGEISFYRIQLDRRTEEGYTEKKRSLTPGHEHCPSCIAYDARGFVPISDSLPLPKQDCQCHTNCKCVMVYRRPNLDNKRTFNQNQLIADIVCPRDSRGRFTGGCYGSRVRAASGGSSGGASEEEMIREANRELNDEIEKHNNRVRRAFGAKTIVETESEPKVFVKSLDEIPQPQTRETNKKKEGKYRRAPTPRPPGDINNVDIQDDGITIWKDKKVGDHIPSYKSGERADYEYKVTHNDKELTLNSNKGYMEVEGELVLGVPDLFPKLQSMENQALFDNMARTMSYVETKPISPPAPQWKPTQHGDIGKENRNLVRSSKGVGDYGGMQIHHVDQWSKDRFDTVTNDLEAKKINLDTAKSRMREMLQPAENVPSGYSIATNPLGQRELVILPGGLHDTNSPLYFANHPVGVHPDTGKLTKFGIPKQGKDAESGSREYFDNFRPKFWREYYKQESRKIQDEINSRFRKGEIDKKTASQMWQTAHKKLVDTNEVLLKRREEINRENAALKARKEGK